MLALMAFYLLMPWVRIGGEQGILLDIVNRQFFFFGSRFIATDTIYLFLILALSALTLFFLTAVVGRIWCGWACPETVFLEFLFRPIERWIEGDHIARRKLDQAPWTLEKIRKKALKHAIYATLSWVIASTFLAYFVGQEPLIRMMTQPPWEHPVAFGATLFVMGLMAFQFGWFREQFCTIVCPYGRFQSVLLDSQSVVIGYDTIRGEPRGKMNPNAPASTGDCIDCGNCVKVCPTGIDIRNGLQMECINCAACIDACDAVMTKIKKPLGLIRYASQAELEGKQKRFFLPRVLAYAGILLLLGGVLIFRLQTRELSEFKIVRGALDAPYAVSSAGRIRNHLHLRLTNKNSSGRSYEIRWVEAPAGSQLIVPVNPYPVDAGQTVTVPVFFEIPEALLKNGRFKTRIEVSDGSAYTGIEEITLLGPGL